MSAAPCRSTSNTCLATRWKRRTNSLEYRSEAGGLSRDGILTALTTSYYPKFIVVYGQTTDESRQPAIFAVIMLLPLWCLYCSSGDRIDDFVVDDKHFLIEIAPRARVLQYQPTKNQKRQPLWTW